MMRERQLRENERATSATRGAVHTTRTSELQIDSPTMRHVLPHDRDFSLVDLHVEKVWVIVSRHAVVPVEIRRAQALRWVDVAWQRNRLHARALHNI